MWIAHEYQFCTSPRLLALWPRAGPAFLCLSDGQSFSCMGPEYPLLPQITTCDVDTCFILDGSDKVTDIDWRNETTALQAITRAMGLGNPGLVSVVTSATSATRRITTLIPPTPLSSVNTSLLLNSTRPGGALNVSQAITTCTMYLKYTTTSNGTESSRGKVIVLLSSANGPAVTNLADNITLVSVPSYVQAGVNGLYPNVSLLNLSLTVAPAICTAPSGEPLLHAHLTHWESSSSTGALRAHRQLIGMDAELCRAPPRTGSKWPCVRCMNVAAGECRRVIRPSGLDLHTSPCITSPMVYNGHADFNETVWYDLSRGHRSSNCSAHPTAASDALCWIYVYTSTGEAGWAPSGMPTQPQDLPCGQAPGDPYVACCGGGQLCSSLRNCECTLHKSCLGTAIPFFLLARST